MATYGYDENKLKHELSMTYTTQTGKSYWSSSAMAIACFNDNDLDSVSEFISQLPPCEVSISVPAYYKSADGTAAYAGRLVCTPGTENSATFYRLDNGTETEITSGSVKIFASFAYGL